MYKLNYKEVKNIIRNNLIPLSIYGNYNNNNKTYFNMEHIIPQSYDNKVSNDMHIIYLAHNKINSIRSNYAFGEICDKNYFINKDDFMYVYIENNNIKICNKELKNMEYYCAFSDNKRIFVPPNFGKGIIARSILYYKNNYKKDIIYNKIINENLLYKWNKMYKVSEEEYIRNNQIYLYQNNYNPYIIFS